MTDRRPSLPEHVTARLRADGTYRVLFEVRRDRPADWPPTMTLPIEAPRRGVLEGDELERIREDAATLAARLATARGEGGPPAASLPAIARRWRDSEGWRELRPRTQVFYVAELRILETWSESLKHPALSEISLPTILQFLAGYSDRPGQRAALRRTLSALYSYAREIGACPVHPFGAPIRVRRARTGRKTPVRVWGASNVRAYVAASQGLAWTGGAILLQAMWETSADATDVCCWRKDEHFIDGPVPRISYRRGKTGILAECPISLELARMIRTNGAIYLVTDPSGKPYPPDDVRADNRRANDFRRVRRAAMAAGQPRLILDHLRHSALTDAIEHGVSFEQARSVSAHADESMIRTVYVQKTFTQALAVQTARGIIPSPPLAPSPAG